jgi:hypothetical protein
MKSRFSTHLDGPRASAHLIVRCPSCSALPIWERWWAICSRTWGTTSNANRRSWELGINIAAAGREDVAAHAVVNRQQGQLSTFQETSDNKKGIGIEDSCATTFQVFMGFRLHAGQMLA